MKLKLAVYHVSPFVPSNGTLVVTYVPSNGTFVASNVRVQEATPSPGGDLDSPSIAGGAANILKKSTDPRIAHPLYI